MGLYLLLPHHSKSLASLTIQSHTMFKLFIEFIISNQESHSCSLMREQPHTTVESKQWSL